MFVKTHQIKLIAIQLLSSLFFLSLGSGFAVASCIVPGTWAPCIELVSDLPWQFNITQDEKEGFRIFYKSREGIEKSGVHLKMALGVGNYDNQEATVESFLKICKEADPDMGLSYGWDLVTVRRKWLYHLHADCTLAEQNFETMVDALEHIIESVSKDTSASLLCRCGGGCKQTE